MCTFYGLHVEIQDTCDSASISIPALLRGSVKRTFLFSNSRISGVCQRARLTIAEASYVVLVPAEILCNSSTVLLVAMPVEIQFMTDLTL
jgi:hypothetical protein